MNRYTIMGIDLVARKVLLADGATECKITDVTGDFAVVALPDGTFSVIDHTAEKMVMQ